MHLINFDIFARRAFVREREEEAARDEGSNYVRARARKRERAEEVFFRERADIDDGAAAVSSLCGVISRGG